jgi:hypothetical protein
LKAQQRRWLQTHCHLLDPRGSQEKRVQAEKESITHEKVWRALSRTAQNQQLVLEEEILSYHSPGSAGPEAFGDSHQKVDDKH